MKPEANPAVDANSISILRTPSKHAIDTTVRLWAGEPQKCTSVMAAAPSQLNNRILWRHGNTGTPEALDNPYGGVNSGSPGRPAAFDPAMQHSDSKRSEQPLRRHRERWRRTGRSLTAEDRRHDATTARPITPTAVPWDQDIASYTDPPAASSTTQPDLYDSETKTYYPMTGIRPVRPSYTALANEPPLELDSSRRLLVILDLNGTLFCRESAVRRRYSPRPFLDQFLWFLKDHCRVMVWSSARAASVDKMLTQGSFEYLNKNGFLDRIWSREHFKLSPEDFDRKVLTLKDLDLVWDAIELDRKSATADECREGGRCGRYDQTNTVLIDDSAHKSQLQPFNCVVLPTFDIPRMRSGEDVELIKVQAYLTRLLKQQNVSAYMRVNPFDSATEGQEPFIDAGVVNPSSKQLKKRMKNIMRRRTKRERNKFLREQARHNSRADSANEAPEGQDSTQTGKASSLEIGDERSY
ncbi:hypothetical protein BGZ98_008628 [Dissophora globulifera]|nr:hypothetical protein BGZ98_008628 [Dissophora globulifera]